MTHLVLKKKGNKWVVYDKEEKKERGEASADKEKLKGEMEETDKKEDKEKGGYCPHCGKAL